ncbi:MAG: hypothetical protein JKY37_16030 [Nannocystaceae bacterium]|nr:hypothetical protein [Nannocystaceae bacterium]
MNSDPTAQIVQPAGDLSVSDGTVLGLEGSGSDVNEPSGLLLCSALTWSSSNPADTFSPSAVGCEPDVTLNGVGSRTIVLTATDGEGASATDSITVTAAGCSGGNCLPSATLGLPSPHDGTAYFIERDLDLLLSISDAESGLLAYELIARRAGEADYTHLDSSFAGPAGVVYSLERSIVLGDGISSWPLCSSPSEYRSYELILTVEDGDGGVTTDSAIIEVGCDLL